MEEGSKEREKKGRREEGKEGGREGRRKGWLRDLSFIRRTSPQRKEETGELNGHTSSWKPKQSLPASL
jgi:hypothetical protein